MFEQSTWSPFAGTLWEGLGGVVLEEGCLWGWIVRGKDSRHFQHALLCARALGLLLSPPGLLLCFPTVMVVGSHFSATIRPHKMVSPSISCLGHGCSVTATGKTNIMSHRKTVCLLLVGEEWSCHGSSSLGKKGRVSIGEDGFGQVKEN